MMKKLSVLLLLPLLVACGQFKSREAPAPGEKPGVRDPNLRSQDEAFFAIPGGNNPINITTTLSLPSNAFLAGVAGAAKTSRIVALDVFVVTNDGSALLGQWDAAQVFTSNTTKIAAGKTVSFTMDLADLLANKSSASTLTAAITATNAGATGTLQAAAANNPVNNANQPYFQRRDLGEQHEHKLISYQYNFYTRKFEVRFALQRYVDSAHTQDEYVRIVYAQDP